MLPFPPTLQREAKLSVVRPQPYYAVSIILRVRNSNGAAERKDLTHIPSINQSINQLTYQLSTFPPILFRQITNCSQS